MKQLKLTFLLTVLMSIVGAKTFAYDIKVENADGVAIYYNYINEGLELEVTNCGFDRFSRPISPYTGDIVIPDEVTYMNRTRKVTSISEKAFFGCGGLTSVTIGNSVTSIGNDAFIGCSGLTSVTIGNSVTSIGSSAFSGCSGLTSVTIGNSVTSIGSSAFYYCIGLISVTIPNSVTSIGTSAFSGCRGLTSVTIGNSVTSIGDYAFSGCSGLTSVTIPNSVTSIGNDAFGDCPGLKKVIVKDIAAWCNIKFGGIVFDYAYHIYSDEYTEITDLVIPNSVTSIGGFAFENCSGLTSVTIPNSVTSIGDFAFDDCDGLTSVTIPNSVTSIGGNAFYCDNLATVISLIENPIGVIFYTVFSQNTLMNATLYVPIGTKETYKATDGWKDFMFIEEGTGGGDEPVTPEIKKCEKPTISYQNGKLIFNCETEGATCVSSISDADMGSYTTNEVELGVNYRIIVYATKDGYQNSETATATLCWIDVEPKTEGITSGVANVPANALLIRNEAGVFTIEGADDDTQVSVYTVNGTQAGSAVSKNGQATVATNLQAGSVAIVKIGEKSVKVVLK